MTIALMQDLVARARAAGADMADAVLVSGTSIGVTRRLGTTEQLERSESQDLGLRVFVGRRSAIVSSTTVDPAGFAQLAERAVAMARIVPEDPFGGLAAAAQVLPDDASLDMDDAQEPDVAALIARASAAEEAALAVPGITNSEGAEAGYGRNVVVLVTSAGFAGTYARTNHSISATAPGRRGHGHAARLRLLQRRAPGRPRRPGRPRSHCRRKGARPHEPGPAAHREAPGRL